MVKVTKTNSPSPEETLETTEVSSLDTPATREALGLTDLPDLTLHPPTMTPANKAQNT